MTKQVPTASVITAYDTALVLAAGDDLVVHPGILLVSTDNYGLGLNAMGSNTITLDGAVGASVQSVALGTDSVLSIGTTGQISANETGIGVSTGDRVINRGVVNAGQSGISAYKSDDFTVVNTGTIETTDPVGAPLYYYANVSSTVVNTGILRAGKSGQAIDSYGISSDVITNKGAIVGAVSLGRGNDTFNGHAGTVNGDISGGRGADIIYNGVDGGSIAGDEGHDTLYGYTGVDTFVFTSHAPADSDTIHSFDTQSDVIQLSQAAFGLAAGEPPAFGLGSRPSSALDHIFYNPTNGGLFYDADGNGTAHGAELIATMDKGLKLSAANFKVV